MWAIALHAGAGNIQKTISDEDKQTYLEALEQALTIGEEVLKSGRSCIECVESVVRYLEDFPLFNAGKGSVCNELGQHELEASIMDGKGAIGSAIGLKTIKNPITLVKHIMQDSSKPYIMYSGEAAEVLADEYKVEKVENSYFFTQKRYDDMLQVQLEQKLSLKVPEKAKKDESTGTVGCAALDINGMLCAGTSTGGMTNKPVGRIGDSPIIGAGTYADSQTCAVSGTGRGETFIKGVICYDVHALMLYKGLSLSDAMAQVIKTKLPNGEGGIIGVDKNGEVALQFSSTGMFRAGANSKGFRNVKIWE